MEISHSEKLLFERTLEKLSQAERALGEARMDMHTLLLQRQQLSAPEQSGESVGQSTTEQQAAEQQAAKPSAPSAPAPQLSGIVNPAGPRINPGVPHINPGAANPPVQPAPLTRPPIQPTPVYSAQANIQPPGQPGSQADQVLPTRSRWWTSEQIVVRVIATLGTLITIAGVFFLVVLAIQNGLLGPLGRVMLASVFSAVMGGIGVIAHKRHAHKAAVGAFCTTSLLSAMATVFSLVVILEWWPEPTGTATIIALMVGFIALATVWNEEGVAIALGIGASIVGSIYFASCVNYAEFSTLPSTLAPTTLAIAAYIRKWSKGIDIAVIFTLITAFFYVFSSDSSTMILPTTPVVVITAVIFVAMGANTERMPWNPLLTIVAPAVLFGLGALGLETMPSLSTHVSTRPLSWVQERADHRLRGGARFGHLAAAGVRTCRLCLRQHAARPLLAGHGGGHRRQHAGGRHQLLDGARCQACHGARPSDPLPEVVRAPGPAGAAVLLPARSGRSAVRRGRLAAPAAGTFHPVDGTGQVPALRVHDRHADVGARQLVGLAEGAFLRLNHECPVFI